MASDTLTASRKEALPAGLYANALDDEKNNLDLLLGYGLRGRLVTLQKNKRFLEQGLTATHCFAVLSGIVRFTETMSDGRRQILKFVFPNEWSFVTEAAPSSFSSEAVTNAVLYVLDARAVGTIVQSEGELSYNWLRNLESEASDAHALIMLLGRKTALERLACFFLTLLHRNAHDSEDANTVNLEIGRSDIADYLGLTPETVSRTFSQMVRRGLISKINRHTLRLNKLNDIERIAAGESGTSQNWETYKPIDAFMDFP